MEGPAKLESIEESSAGVSVNGRMWGSEWVWYWLAWSPAPSPCPSRNCALLLPNDHITISILRAAKAPSYTACMLAVSGWPAGPLMWTIKLGQAKLPARGKNHVVSLVCVPAHYTLIPTYSLAAADRMRFSNSDEQPYRSMQLLRSWSINTVGVTRNEAVWCQRPEVRKLDRPSLPLNMCRAR